MSPEKPKSRILEYLLIFALVYILVTYFFPGNNQQQSAQKPVVTMTPLTSSVSIGNYPILIVHNPAVRSVNQGWLAWAEYQWCHYTGGQCAAIQPTSYGPTVIVQNTCPKPPVAVSYEAAGASGGTLTPRTSTDTAAPCVPTPPVLPGTDARVSLAPWKYSVFGDIGTYHVALPVTIQPVAGTGTVTTTTASGTTLKAVFTVTEPNPFVKLFRAVISKPLLNFLVFVGSVTPDHNLAVGIIILTIFVKLLLFIPTQHAMEGQKKMQLLQPKLEAVRKKYPNDPGKVQEETVKLWKEYKVNPVQSCLPLVLQFPVLIGLLYSVQGGANIGLSKEYLYPLYQHLTWTFNYSFFGIDLTHTNYWLFPFVLIVLQFIQMKLSFAIADKKKAKAVEKAEKEPDNPMAMQQTMMLYVLPLMIGFFALRFPAAVALYWGVSTLFAIGQQYIVNREHFNVRT